MTALQRTQQALQAIAEAGAEGMRIFTRVYADAALAAAQAADARAAAGICLGPLDLKCCVRQPLLRRMPSSCSACVLPVPS